MHCCWQGDFCNTSNKTSAPVSLLPQDEDLNDIVPLGRRSNDIVLQGGEGGHATIWTQKNGSEVASLPTDITLAVHGDGRCAVEPPDSAQPGEHGIVGIHSVEANAPREIHIEESADVTDVCLGLHASATDHLPSTDTPCSPARVQEVALFRRRSENWKSKVYDLSRRAVSLEDLFSFYSRLGNESGPMPHFDPSCSTTNDVVRSAIIPESSHRCCALATLFNSGQPKIPQKMVTHHWSNRFTHTLAAIVADALNLPTYQSIVQRLLDGDLREQLNEELREKGKLSLYYWLCALSVNQHCSICGGCAPGVTERDSVTKCIISFCECGTPKHFFGDDCEMNKFNEMMALLCKQVPCFGQVVAVDECFEIFSRAWCVAEIVEARQNDMPQYLKIHSVASLKAHSQIVKCLDVRDCRASRPEDKDAILAGIKDIDAFNDYLHELLMGQYSGLLVEAFQLIAGYTLWWDGFSNDYLFKLSQREHHIVPLCLVVIVPILVSLVFMIFPLTPPGQVWQDQFLFSYVYVPSFASMCLTYFPIWVAKQSGMELDSVVCVRLFVWLATDTLAISIVMFCCTVALDNFPVPWGLVITAVVNLGFQPLMWFCAPVHQRRDSRFKWRFFDALASIVAILFLFGMMYPFLTFAIKNVSRMWQMVLVLVFLASKLLFEHLGRLIAQRNTADKMPGFIMVGSYSYEVNMCIIFCGGFDWMVFIELVSFDAIENLFHLWSLSRDRHRSLQGNPNKIQDHSGTQMYIVSVLLVRELCEVMVPAQFLAVISLTRLIQPRFVDIICDMNDDQLRQAQLFLVADICVEMVLASITYVVLKYNGFRPFHLLCSLASKERALMLTWSPAGLTYFLLQFHSHFGTDLTFTFPWLQNDHAIWHCGLTWSS